MPSYTKVTSKLHKISNISSAVGISYVKNCTIPLKDVSEDFQIILSPIIRYKEETVVFPTKVKENSTFSKLTLLKTWQDQRQEYITTWIIEMKIADEEVITVEEKLLENKT